jgi:carbonic anhydrase
MFNDAGHSPAPAQQTQEPQRSLNYATRTIGANFIPRPQRAEKQILWIGCSDSDCKETTILDFLPDEMLEHRNLGNMIIDGDLSCETAVRHAVVDLQVRYSSCAISDGQH